jgi:hypothetical protein
MAARQVLCVGTVQVTVTDGYTSTRFADGTELHAAHTNTGAVGDLQTRLAHQLGYPDMQSMNREHDIAHHLLALWLGLPYSLTLHAAATGHVYAHAEVEEAAVMALVRLMRVLGLAVMDVARRATSPLPGGPQPATDDGGAVHGGEAG